MKNKKTNIKIIAVTFAFILMFSGSVQNVSASSESVEKYSISGLFSDFGDGFGMEALLVRAFTDHEVLLDKQFSYAESPQGMDDKGDKKTYYLAKTIVSSIKDFFRETFYQVGLKTEDQSASAISVVDNFSEIEKGNINILLGMCMFTGASECKSLETNDIKGDEQSSSLEYNVNTKD